MIGVLRLYNVRQIRLGYLMYKIALVDRLTFNIN